MVFSQNKWVGHGHAQSTRGSATGDLDAGTWDWCWWEEVERDLECSLRKRKLNWVIFFVLFYFILLCERKNRWKKTEKRLKKFILLCERKNRWKKNWKETKKLSANFWRYVNICWKHMAPFFIQPYSNTRMKFQLLDFIYSNTFFCGH
jgi:hypothetical protein